ncbi:MAG: hypothetical protein QM756_38990 [Polyangiaceae bacterium]
MKHWKYAAPAVLGLVCACSGPDQDQGKSGSLSLALTATDSQGELYRLRSATFNINGYPDFYFASSGGEGGSSSSSSSFYSETVSTESQPNQPVITRRVVPGYYYVTFDTWQPWYIEHVTADGAERVSQSVLLSAPTQWAYVYDRGNSSVFYQFGVNGNVLDFRHGDLSIRIGVEHPDDEGQAGSPGTAGTAGI